MAGNWAKNAGRFGAREGAELRGIDEPGTAGMRGSAAPVRARTHDAAPDDWERAEEAVEALGSPNAVHTHIWLDPRMMAPAQPAPRQATRDAAAPTRGWSWLSAMKRRLWS